MLADQGPVTDQTTWSECRNGRRSLISMADRMFPHHQPSTEDYYQASVPKMADVKASSQRVP